MKLKNNAYEIKNHAYEIKIDAYKNTLICNNNFKKQEGGSMSNILHQSNTDDKLVYSVEELQRLLGLGRNNTYDLVNSGVFPVVRVNNRILIPKEPFLQWLHRGNFQGR